MLKPHYILILFSIAVLFTTSCKKKYTCTCTERYEGVLQSYNTVISEKEMQGKTKEEVEQECDKGDAGPQKMLGETWGVDCELK